MLNILNEGINSSDVITTERQLLNITDNSTNIIEMAGISLSTNKKMKYKDSLSSYVRLINEVKSEKLPIEVLFGLEVCYVPEYKDEIERILERYQFDFLVCLQLSHGHQDEPNFQQNS